MEFANNIKDRQTPQAAQSNLEETGELLPGISKSEDTESFGLSLPTKRR